MAPVDCKLNTEAVRQRALLALRKALKVASSGTDLDVQGYAARPADATGGLTWPGGLSTGETNRGYDSNGAKSNAKVCWT